jgi:uncharacterized OB-fold protein
VPRIGPPKDDYVEVVPLVKDSRWYAWYFDCVNWKCVECGCVNFGRNKYCPYCKIRLKKETLRPKDYVEAPYEG